MGRLITMVGAAAQQTDYGYDLNGDLASVVDPELHETNLAYDGLRRLVSQTRAVAELDAATTTAYAADDSVTGVTDPRGNGTAFLTNGFGEAIQLSSPDAGTTVYAYDAGGPRPLYIETDHLGTPTCPP